ncbi:MAG: hypothetical protein MAG453_00932 [Calditrichaeota bacterium]|nr:hypothetical protein [Calditrichota bacterium]
MLILLAGAILLAALLPAGADARRRFEEGDWLSWPDLRRFVDFEVGRNHVYIATDNGILRWDRTNERWLDPWFSVPGPLEQAIFLREVVQVREDPLTEDVWVELPDGWVMRDHSRRFWERKDAPSGSLRERLYREKTPKARPDRGLIAPFLYQVDVNDDALKYRNQEWPFAGGTEDGWGIEIYGWDGFGVGTLDKYSPTLELYPQGVGPCPGLAVTDSTVWAAGDLDYDDGWLWKRSRAGENERWQFFHPAVVWGLETGSLTSLQVDESGRVWLATDDGIMFGNGKRFRHLRKQDGMPSSRLHDVQPFAGGAWVATRYGLAFIDPEKPEIIRPDREAYPEVAGGMWGQLAAYGDTLYASGPGMLVKHTRGGGWVEIEVPTTVGAGSDPITLWADGGWIAIGDRTGIAWRSPEGEWRQAFATQWRDGYVFSIDFHGGYFWLGTDRGLAKYDPVEKDAILYTVEEGLPGNVIYEVFGDGDWLWLATDVSLAKFLWNVPERID